MVTTTFTARALALVGKLLPGAPIRGTLSRPAAFAAGVGERSRGLTGCGGTGFVPECRSALWSAQRNG